MTNFLVHLICGSTGAGKTTYSQRLSDQVGGVRYSIDEWMATLFWMDAAKPIEAAWSMERVERCYKQICHTAASVAARGVPCVLDLGLTQRSSRMRFATWANDQGLSVQLHFLDIPTEERWRRVQMRNAQQGAAYQLPFDVTKEMFDFVETLFEPPSSAELAKLNGVRRELLGRVKEIYRRIMELEHFALSSVWLHGDGLQ